MKAWTRVVAALAAMAAASLPAARAQTAYALSGGSPGYTVVSGPTAYYGALLDVWPKTYYGMSRPWYYWSETLYVACGSQGLYVSPNGGYSFQKMPVVVNGADINAAVYDIAFDRDGTNAVVATYLATDKGLYVNRGGGWGRVSLPGEYWPGGMGVARVGTGPSGTVIADSCLSTDGGMTFRALSMPRGVSAYPDLYVINRYGSIFGGSEEDGLCVTRNGGASWVIERHPYGGYVGEWNVDAMASDSRGRVWAGTPDGAAVYEPSSGTFSNYWVSTRGINDIFLTEFAGEPTHVYLACDGPYGIYVSHDGGITYARAGFGRFLDADLVYVSCQGAVYGAFSTAGDAAKPESVLAWSSDGGRTFGTLTNGLPARISKIHAITGVPQPEL